MRLALSASILLVLGSPYVGQIRGAVQSSFPAHYRTLVAGTVAVGLVVALMSAVRAIRRRQPRVAAGGVRPARSRPALRYGLVASALLIAVAYAFAVQSGNVDVDLVEAFHFVEYGAIAFLYHRIWRHRPDLSALVLPAAAALGVGIADEWVQWFVPGRVGELHDVGLNAVAIVCGLLVGMAVDVPSCLQFPRTTPSRLHLGGAIVAVAVALAVFVDVVHVGYEVQDGEGRTFRSQFDAETLPALSEERTIRWRSSPPPSGAFAREDRYLSEGEWHVQHRNVAESRGQLWVSWNENAILERFYPPVLDLGFRWAYEQRLHIERAVQEGGRRPYVSAAEPYPLYVIDRRLLWAATGALALTVAVIVRPRRAKGVQGS